MNANNKNYSIRPLTAEEREFAADMDNYNYLFFYMKKWDLEQDEWYDILIEPYLNAVKKYHEYESARQYAFSTVLKNMLYTAFTRELKKRRAKKRMPEGGLVSLDYTMEGDNPFAEYNVAEWWVDKKDSVEKQVIFKELFAEFYKKCITYEDDFWGEDAINEYLKMELDLLLEGYSVKQANRKTENKYQYGYNAERLERDLISIRKKFTEVFCI